MNSFTYKFGSPIMNSKAPRMNSFRLDFFLKKHVSFFFSYYLQFYLYQVLEEVSVLYTTKFHSNEII